jgi:hypothetical protein
VLQALARSHGDPGAQALSPWRGRGRTPLWRSWSGRGCPGSRRRTPGPASDRRMGASPGRGHRAAPGSGPAGVVPGGLEFEHVAHLGVQERRGPVERCQVGGVAAGRGPAPDVAAQDPLDVGGSGRAGADRRSSSARTSALSVIDVFCFILPRYSVPILLSGWENGLHVSGGGRPPWPSAGRSHGPGGPRRHPRDRRCRGGRPG